MSLPDSGSPERQEQTLSKTASNPFLILDQLSADLGHGVSISIGNWGLAENCKENFHQIHKKTYPKKSSVFHTTV